MQWILKQYFLFKEGKLDLDCFFSDGNSFRFNHRMLALLIWLREGMMDKVFRNMDSFCQDSLDKTQFFVLLALRKNIRNLDTVLAPVLDILDKHMGEDTPYYLQDARDIAALEEDLDTAVYVEKMKKFQEFKQERC